MGRIQEVDQSVWLSSLFCLCLSAAFVPLAFHFRFFFVFVELGLCPSSCWSAPPCTVSYSSSIGCAEAEAPTGFRGVLVVPSLVAAAPCPQPSCSLSSSFMGCAEAEAPALARGVPAPPLAATALVNASASVLPSLASASN